MGVTRVMMLCTLLLSTNAALTEIFEIMKAHVVENLTPVHTVYAKHLSQCAILCFRQPWSNCAAFNHRAGGRCEMLSRSDICKHSPTIVDDSDGTFAIHKVPCPETCPGLKRHYPQRVSGVYQLYTLTWPVYCDQKFNGGGWTLLLTASTATTWNPVTVRARNVSQPSLTSDYSILELGDQLVERSAAPDFLYRLEGRTEETRLRWGGIWRANRSQSLIRWAPGPATTLITRFSNWTTSAMTIEDRLPWINNRNWWAPEVVLTTSAGEHTWGTIASTQDTKHSHSAWISDQASDSGTVLFWIRV